MRQNSLFKTPAQAFRQPFKISSGDDPQNHTQGNPVARIFIPQSLDASDQFPTF